MNRYLFIGNKNYSSWSLRAWLCLRWAGISFTERLLHLDQPGYGHGKIEEVLSVSPTGKVPALRVEGTIIWDTLAIAEWVAEQASGRELWPFESLQRAQARSIVCEMHSGFAALRRDLPMNIHRRCPAQVWASHTQDDIDRVINIWDHQRIKHEKQGPFLLGKRSMVDVFFTPVATRFRTYGVMLPEHAQTYCDTLLNDADFKVWESQSLPNSWDDSGYSVIDNLYADK